MASIPRNVEVKLRCSLVLDDRTRAALEALGWTPPVDDPAPSDPAADAEQLLEPVREALQ